MFQNTWDSYIINVLHRKLLLYNKIRPKIIRKKKNQEIENRHQWMSCQCCINTNTIIAKTTENTPSNFFR